MKDFFVWAGRVWDSRERSDRLGPGNWRTRSLRRLPQATGDGLRPKVRLRSGLFLVAALWLVAGCAVSFVSPFDELTNAAIHDAAVKAETIFAKVTVSKEPYAKVRADYRELDGKLAVIAMRAESYGRKNEAEQAVVKLFQEEMGELEAFHRDVAPYRASQLAGARSILRSLVHHQKAKKAAIGAPAGGGAQ